jgi:lipopolysaccharide export LptBFGC system permease protein LptF
MKRLWTTARTGKLELTRSRAYKKNDQAWIEQKNGAVVRRLVGYGRLEGVMATAALGELHELARLYVNFFQPSFKLKSKTRQGAKVTKKYHVPATPYERLLTDDRVTNESKKQSDTPRKAGGLMSWAASKAVGPSV